MKKWIMLIALTMSASAFAATAFLKYERQSGMTKQCVYDYLGSEYTRTIQSYQLCPQTIQVNR